MSNKMTYRELEEALDRKVSEASEYYKALIQIAQIECRVPAGAFDGPCPCVTCIARRALNPVINWHTTE